MIVSLEYGCLLFLGKVDEGFVVLVGFRSVNYTWFVVFLVTEAFDV